jgi:hypothetical protein
MSAQHLHSTWEKDFQIPYLQEDHGVKYVEHMDMRRGKLPGVPYAE